jgi:glycosyltransferase involved in cell wall biosynthesis
MNGWHTLSEIFALNYLKKHRKSYVFYINGGIIRPKESHFMKRLKTHYISGADLYFSPDENSNRYLTYYGSEQGKIVNYPYATIYENEILKQPLTRTEKGSLRSELNIHGTKIFISCGQFIARKNYARLIEYWSNQPSDYTLILIGGGKEKRKYQKLIKKHALQNVILKDFMDKQSLFKYFQAADGYLFPSKEDIYGHVVNEALSQGLPVISNINVNSALCLINNGKNGYIVNFDNDKEISDSIAHVINDEAMPYEALKTARENTIEKMAKRHVTIFKKWVENK